MRMNKEQFERFMEKCDNILEKIDLNEAALDDTFYEINIYSPFEESVVCRIECKGYRMASPKDTRPVFMVVESVKCRTTEENQKAGEL